MSLPTISADELEFNDPPSLIWIRVRDAVKLVWVSNFKLHDAGGVIESIRKHGFQEIPKFDLYLDSVSGSQDGIKGAIKAGNGRIECLDMMERQGDPLPRGLAREKSTGAWVMPLLIGTDAQSAALARAYAVDSNSLVLTGADMGLFDVARIYDPTGFIAVMEQQAIDGVMPVTIDEDDLEAFKRSVLGGGVLPDDLNGLLGTEGESSTTASAKSSDVDEDGDDGDEDDDIPDSADYPVIQARVPPELYRIYLDITDDFGDNDNDRMEGLLLKYKSAMRRRQYAD